MMFDSNGITQFVVRIQIRWRFQFVTPIHPSLSFLNNLSVSVSLSDMRINCE